MLVTFSPFSAIGPSIHEITPPELLTVLRKIELRGAINQAHRVREICSLVFRYAIASGKAERDTAADLRGALKARAQTPRAAITDPDKIGGLIRAIEDFEGTFVVKCGLQLPALTFLRPGEVRGGGWSEIDFKKILCIPAERMKMRREHLVSLSRQACVLLQKLHELTGHGELMFPGLRSPKIPSVTPPLSPPCAAWGTPKKKCAPMVFAQWQALCSTNRDLPCGCHLKTTCPQPTQQNTRYLQPGGIYAGTPQNHAGLG